MFNKQWFLKYQRILLFLSNTWIGRKIFRIDGKRSSVGKNKIIAIIPNAIFWKEKDEFVVEFRTHKKFSKRLFYVFKPVWYLMHWWDILIANQVKPDWNLGFDSLTVYPDADPETTSTDGDANRASVDQTFTDIRSGAGTGQDPAGTNGGPYLAASTTTDQFAQQNRYFGLFDTSSLDDDATVSAATLSIYGAAKSNNLGSPEIVTVSSSPASNTNIVAADYAIANFGSTEFASRLSYASFTTSAYNDISLNASGISNISLTGISKFGIISGWDFDNSFGGSWSSAAVSQMRFNTADVADTTTDPKLAITFSLPSSGNFLPIL